MPDMLARRMHSGNKGVALLSGEFWISDLADVRSLLVNRKYMASVERLLAIVDKRDGNIVRLMMVACVTRE